MIDYNVIYSRRTWPFPLDLEIENNSLMKNTPREESGNDID